MRLGSGVGARGRGLEWGHEAGVWGHEVGVWSGSMRSGSGVGGSGGMRSGSGVGE